VEKRKILILYDNEDFAHEIEYTFQVLFSVIRIPYKVMPYSQWASQKEVPSLVISYGAQRTFVPHQVPLIHVYPSDFFADGYLTQTSLPDRPLSRFEDLPVIYAGNGEINTPIERSGSLIETNIDIIASSFFMLTRYEEVVAPVQDRFERFPAIASLAYREGFLDRPIVNEYIELLWSWIDSLTLGFERKKLWAGKNFAVCLTHDVDRIRLYNRFRHVAGTILRTVVKQKQPSNLLRIGKDYFKTKLGLQKDPYDKFDRILDLEREFDARSSFFFMSGGNSERYDNKYDITQTQGLIKSIIKVGSEIGLHGSFNSYIDETMIQGEKAMLETVKGDTVLGTRQHYLRWRTPETWRIQEKAGLQYDTTLSFADHAGFRCGICHPYRPFDVVERRMLDIWEVPLIVMEGSLFGYQNMSLEDGWQAMKELIDTVERYKGVFVTLWHNSTFYELEHPGRLELYRRMLNYVVSKGALRNTVLQTLKTWQKPTI
jgi:peptidoglycan/xylan/chitin deacetylase (PgdA/CDA1 family)